MAPKKSPKRTRPGTGDKTPGSIPLGIIQLLAKDVASLLESPEKLKDMSKEDFSILLKEAVALGNSDVQSTYRMATKYWEVQQFEGQLPQDLLDLIPFDSLSFENVLKWINPTAPQFISQDYVNKLLFKLYSLNDKSPASETSESTSVSKGGGRKRRITNKVKLHTPTTPRVARNMAPASSESEDESIQDVGINAKKKKNGQEDDNSCGDSVNGNFDNEDSSDDVNELQDTFERQPINIKLKKKIKKGEFTEFSKNFKLEEFTSALRAPLKEYWNISLKAFISINVNGICMFKIKHGKVPHLIISFPTNAKEIMDGVPKNAKLSQLTLVQSVLPPLETFPFHSLRKMVLYCVRDDNERNLRNLLRECFNLEDLFCWVDIPRSRPKQNKRRVELDLSTDLCKKLKKLALSSAVISCKANVSEHSKFACTAVEELYLDCVYFRDDVLNKFHLIFPALKKVTLRTPVYISKGHPNLIGVSVKLLAELLKIKTIQTIQIIKMHGDFIYGPKLTKDEHGSVTEILRRVNGVNKINHNFILTKNKKDEWSGKVLANGSQLAKAALGWEYNLNMKDVYNTAQTFEDCSPEGQSEPEDNDDEN